MGNYKFLPWIYITTNEKDCFAKKKPISIWDSHNGDYEEYDLFWCYTV
jgi:hypothetical protein